MGHHYSRAYLCGPGLDHLEGFGSPNQRGSVSWLELVGNVPARRVLPDFEYQPIHSVPDLEQGCSIGSMQSPTRAHERCREGRHDGQQYELDSRMGQIVDQRRSVGYTANIGGVRPLQRTSVAFTLEPRGRLNALPNVRAEATREAGRLGRTADDKHSQLCGQGGLPRGVASRARG
jgi:hypothetical protein